MKRTRGPQPDRPWTSALRAAIRAAVDTGHSYRDIARLCGVSYAELHRITGRQRAGTRMTAEQVAQAMGALASLQRRNAAEYERRAWALRAALKTGGAT